MAHLFLAAWVEKEDPLWVTSIFQQAESQQVEGSGLEGAHLFSASFFLVISHLVFVNQLFIFNFPFERRERIFQQRRQVKDVRDMTHWQFNNGTD